MSNELIEAQEPTRASDSRVLMALIERAAYVKAENLLCIISLVDGRWLCPRHEDVVKL